MQLSIKSVEVFRQMFEHVGIEIPAYAEYFLQNDFDADEIHDCIVQRVQDLVNELSYGALIQIGMCTMLFTAAGKKLNPKDMETVEALGGAAALVTDILDKEDETVRENFTQLSNFYYGMIFSFIADTKDALTIAPMVKKSLHYAHELKNSGGEKIRSLMDQGFVDLNNPAAIRDAPDDDKEGINKAFATSSIIMTMIATFLDTVGGHLMKEGLV